MKKIFLSAAILVLLAAGCGKQQVQTNQNPQSQNAQQGQQKIEEPQQQTNGQKPAPLSVRQTVEGSNLNQLNTEYKEGQTALDLLKATHRVEVKSYSGIGEMVVAIDGNKADSKHFWEFFVNGKSSDVGAGSYKLQNSNQVEWKLSAIK